uniref:Cmp-n-acetylneuraminate-beta-galactosamide-alpha--sialyltransferase 1 n=1 Tax=Tetraselmis sp. GSL018 TaxID=582737 RepID=A0A061SF14_9CHLO|mmetsp:Transcript_15007/g.35759  ORF Transcript_15007/g.35759 Transcript_15007/m.35759 type:complete len:154 (+) Transcript_15007:970-1431(+)
MSIYLPRLREHMQETEQGQGMQLAVADRRFMYHANHVLDVFRRCGAISRGVPAPTKRKSASSGLVATLSALHLCKHVSVFGVGEPKLNEGDFFHYYMDHYFHGSHGTADIAAHEFNIEHDIFDELAKIGLIRHCTVSGCKGKYLPSEMNGKDE